MTSIKKKLFRRWLAPLLFALLLSAVGLFLLDHLPVSEAQGQYIPPTESPGDLYPGPTDFPTSEPYPGVPTSTTPPTVPAVTTAPVTPTTTLTATPTLTGTLTVTGTLIVSPQPTLDLLYPGELPQTASPTPVIIYVREGGSGAGGVVLGPPARLLVVIVLLLWGLLGAFLVVYIRRLGY